MAQNSLGRDKLSWSPETWQEIDKAVLDAVGAIRVAQRVFPASTEGNGQYVPDDTINRAGGKLSIPEGETKPYVELSVDFALTDTQIENEPTLHTGRTLAMQAAKTLAQAEDRAFFEGNSAFTAPRGGGGRLQVTDIRVANAKTIGTGLLNLPNIHTEPVPPLAAAGTWGENAFAAVVKGISHLTGKNQPGPYALILGLDVYADAFAPVGATLTTTADRLTPLLTGGFLVTGAIPNQTGLLASLGGQPTTLFVGQDAITAFTQEDVNGNSQLRVFERVQIVPREADAFVKLDYK